MAGPSGATSRLALPYPIPDDTVDVPRDVQALAAMLDPKTAIYLQGTLAARPAAGIAGRFYFATDKSTVSYDNGTGWIVVRLEQSYWAYSIGGNGVGDSAEITNVSPTPYTIHTDASKATPMEITVPPQPVNRGFRIHTISAWTSANGGVAEISSVFLRARDASTNSLQALIRSDVMIGLNRVPVSLTIPLFVAAGVSVKIDTGLWTIGGFSRYYDMAWDKLRLDVDTWAYLP